jgi:hypothetical protein
MNKLANYLKEILGVDTMIFPLEKQLYQKLPLYLTANYTANETSLFSKRICLLSLTGEDMPTPDQLSKQMTLASRQTGLPVVFIFDKVLSYNLKRLVAKGVNFIIPGKQLFIPALMMDLHKMPEKPQKKQERLTPVAQFLLLYHLQKERLTGRTMRQLTALFPQTYLTINRAVKNMEELGLCQLTGGKEKEIQFTGKGKNLWLKAQEFFQTPVERILYTDERLEAACISNINALAHYTMLNDESKRHYAIDKQELVNLKIATNKYAGDNTVEIWRYNPTPLSHDGFIDKLSLYLLLKTDENERVQGELEQMINEIQWLEE